MYKCALFDLDGTLVDTSIDLGRATAYVLEQYGYEARWTDADYRSFVGNGARKLVERAFEHKLSESELDAAFEMFKKKYNEILIDNAFIYDGMSASLDYLKQKDVSLAVVTNKPHISAVLMVEELFGKDYFDFIIGASELYPKKPDPYSTFMTLGALDCRNDEAMFFGDSDVDIQTSHNAGIYSVACSWGFRPIETLSAADKIITNPQQIKALI